MTRRWWICGVASLAALSLWCACGSDTRLAGKKLRSPTVKTVAHYDITLDQSATPKQVAYVALRAIRDDVLAENREQREAALDKQFDVCAAGVIAGRNKTSLPRDEFLHKVVYHWAPTAAHYVADFPTDWESADARLVVENEAPPKDAKADRPEASVAIALADPSHDPRASVVLKVWLVQDAGYWRVTHLSFDPARRSLTG